VSTTDYALGISGGGGALEPVEETFIVVSNGQTVFTITYAPDDVTDTEFFVQGVNYVYGTDFTVVGTTVTWAGGFSLSIGDVVMIRYYYVP
jgi:hypothetical protein